LHLIARAAGEDFMANGTITIRTDPRIEEQINALAAATQRSRNWIIEDAIKQYLLTNAWQVEGIRQAQESLKEGKGESFDEVLTNLQAKIDRKQKERPR
jgi:predicted transcriptional regulator